MKVLITAFDPFGGESVNPACQAVMALPDRIGDHMVVKQELPTVFGKAGALLLETIDTVQPDAVLCVGQAGGRAAITLERVAVNLRDARIADNEGRQPEDEPIVPDGPAAYFATIPTRKLVQALREREIPAALSYTAGTFVCNDVLYTLLHRLSGTDIIGGFVHVPYTAAQAAGKSPNPPSMALQTMVQALQTMVENL